jgi:hypothetical protein
LPIAASVTLFPINFASKRGDTMPHQSTLPMTRFKNPASTFLTALSLLLLAACASVPPPNPIATKNYQKIGLVRVTSDEELFVSKRRFNREDEGRGSMGTSMGLVGLLLDELANLIVP